METINISNKVSRIDYQNFIFKKSYKHPVVIFLSIAGILCLVTWIMWLFDIYPGKQGSNPPIFALFFGIFCALIPFLTRRSAGKLYDNQLKLNSKTQYTFSDEGIFVTGDDFATSVGWSSVLKTEESKKFLLLYTSKNAAEIVSKQSLDPGQIKTIKAMAFKL